MWSLLGMLALAIGPSAAVYVIQKYEYSKQTADANRQHQAELANAEKMFAEQREQLITANGHLISAKDNLTELREQNAKLLEQNSELLERVKQYQQEQTRLREFADPDSDYNQWEGKQKRESETIKAMTRALGGY